MGFYPWHVHCSGQTMVGKIVWLATRLLRQWAAEKSFRDRCGEIDFSSKELEEFYE